MRRALLAAILALGSGLVARAGDGGVERAGTGHTDRAAAWLELKADQRRYRERLAPLSAGEDTRLRLLEAQQRAERRALEQRQRRQGALPKADSEARPGDGLGQRLRQQRQIESQRLDARIERQAQGFHRD